jgi:hypothetical protein
MTIFDSDALTRADIWKIEEALNTNDLEVMVAAVDRIVDLRVKAAVHHIHCGIASAHATAHNRRADQ